MARVKKLYEVGQEYKVGISETHARAYMNKMIAQTPGLYEELSATGWTGGELTPRQQEIIHKYLGEP